MKWLICLLSGNPHFIVGSKEDPYLLRWFLIPRNRYFNIYLHRFCRDDDDRALHDHPWWSWSLILWGGYYEQTEKGLRWFRPLSLIYRPATYRHRIVVSQTKRAAWTLFVTGPKIRTWGFWCEGTRFVPWQEFVAGDNPGEIGKGCGE